MSERTIKRLDWIREEDGWWSAQPDLMFRGYEVRITPRGAIRARRGNEDWFEFDGTVAEAKAHWQRDFETRVQNCLCAQPSHTPNT